MSKDNENSKAEPGSLSFALQATHGDFKPYVLALVWDAVTKLVVSRQVVVTCPFEARRTRSAFLEKLGSQIPDHGLTELQVLNSPILVEEKTMVSVGGATEYVTLIVVGIACQNVGASQSSCRKFLLDLTSMRSAILGQKGLPVYLWHIYNTALNELEKLMRK